VNGSFTNKHEKNAKLRCNLFCQLRVESLWLNLIGRLLVHPHAVRFQNFYDFGPACKDFLFSGLDDNSNALALRFALVESDGKCRLVLVVLMNAQYGKVAPSPLPRTGLGEAARQLLSVAASPVTTSLKKMLSFQSSERSLQ